MAPKNLDRLARIYGPATWDVYDQLDLSLDPEGPDSLFDDLAGLVGEGSVILDVGCRDGAHLVEIVERFHVVGIGIEPVPLHIERAEQAIAASTRSDDIVVHQATMHNIPLPDSHVDAVWCRDVLEQVDDVDSALCELVRVVKPGAPILVYTTVVTDRLTPAERTMLTHSMGNVDENLDRSRIEAAFDTAGLTIESVRPIGTEWREHAEERTQPVSRALLRLARLGRQEAMITAQHGQDIFDHVEANLHWELFQFLGKLSSLVYLLRAPTGRRRG